MSLLGEGRRVVFGEGRVNANPRYWRTGPVTADDGTPFEVMATTEPWYVDGVGGETVFREVALQLSHTLGGDFRVTPYVNGSATPVSGNGVSVEVVPFTFTLPQLAAGAELRRETVIVPLVRRLLVAGIENSRYYLRGQSLMLLVERVSTLGAGVLHLDGCRMYHEPTRRTDHQLAVR